VHNENGLRTQYEPLPRLVVIAAATTAMVRPVAPSGTITANATTYWPKSACRVGKKPVQDGAERMQDLP
jgi:hypothetical protein